MRSMIDKICVCVVLSSFLSCVSAQPHVNTCDRERDQLDGLALSSCSTTDGVLISEYREPVPLSLYATEFDRRRFFVAYSANEEALFKRVGLRKIGREVSLISTQLAEIPARDQLGRRHVLRRKIRRGGWLVYRESLQYFAQGRAMGYAMECGTAIRRLPSTRVAVAASECFSYENEDRFFQTLSEIIAADAGHSDRPAKQ
jgi:hypothetical protein